jgi:radical SAM protein (TIGR01212 family)
VRRFPRPYPEKMKNSGFPWLTHKAWALERYGHPVFRVPVDPGWSCPNRDAEGKGGCTFCAEDGGRARQLGDAADLAEQVQRAAAFARERYRARHLQLYLQAYTATYADVGRLQSVVEPLLEMESFHSLSLGTRPDCLSKSILELLRAWNRRVEVWVELGVQTTHDETLRRIQRGHDWARSEDAIRRLDALSLRPCAHLIFGLPGESTENMLESIDRVCRTPVHGLKLHNLHVLRDSPLGAQWLREPFEVMCDESYLDFLADAIRRIPAHLPLFRIITDSPPDQRLAPRQTLKKGQFLHQLEQKMRLHGWRQGDQCPENGAEKGSDSAVEIQN